MSTPDKAKAAGATLRQSMRNLKPRSGLRVLHLLALFLTLAGISHLATILLVPRYASLDSASMFVGSGADGKADLVNNMPGQDIAIIDADPLTAIGVCGFDLADGPLRISARSGQTPLALSVHVRGGGVFYAVTDKAAQRGVIEFVVLNEAQLDERLSRDDEGDGARELRVLAPARQGIVVIRALVRQPSDRPVAEALVKAMACGTAG